MPETTNKKGGADMIAFAYRFQFCLTASVFMAALLVGATIVPAQQAPSMLGASVPANPLSGLLGRWTGTGVAELANGHREPFTCVVTYIHDAAKSELRQGLRCESPNVKMSTSAVMQVSGTALSGVWQEKIYEAKGQVAGALTAEGMAVAVTYQARQAQVQVVANGACEQTISVATKPGDMLRSVTAHLKRC
jgi:hypothetical protein